MPDHVEPAPAGHANDYDVLAEAYAAENETGIANAYYERPAVLALAGEVAGRRILDAGCGSGALTKALRDRGAVMSGIDSSTAMLELARRRLGGGADLRAGDLRDPLPFPDGVFDDVIASLVLHYLQDWGPTLGELRRVLRAGGRLIVSVDHPFAIHALQRRDGQRTDYFATYSWTEEWTMGGRTVPMRFWNRPLHAMTDAFTAAGFHLSAISEPQPVPGVREEFPEEFEALTTSPSFLFFVLEAADRVDAVCRASE